MSKRTPASPRCARYRLAGGSCEAQSLNRESNEITVLLVEDDDDQRAFLRAAFQSFADIRQAYLLGASSFLTKPAGFPALRVLLQKVHDYWAECEVPEVDADGYAVETISKGKAGARFSKPNRSP